MESEKFSLKNVFLYFSVSFTIQEVAEANLLKFEAREQLKQKFLEKPEIEAIECLTKNREFAIFFQENAQQEFSTLANYCKIENSRLAPVYLQNNIFMRIQLRQKALGEWNSLFAFLGEKTKVVSAIITLLLQA